MTLRLTLTLDEELAGELIGVLAKGLGRGEMGIRGMSIESLDTRRYGVTASETPDPELENLIKRLPGKRGRPPMKTMKTTTEIAETKHRRRARRVDDGPTAAEFLHEFLKTAKPASWAQMRQKLVNEGFAPTTLNSTLKRLRVLHPEVHRDPSTGLFTIQETTP